MEKKRDCLNDIKLKKKKYDSDLYSRKLCKNIMLLKRPF